jgi:phosphate transport system permease protein
MNLSYKESIEKLVFSDFSNRSLTKSSKEKLASYIFSTIGFFTAAMALFIIGFIFYIAWPTFESQGIINFITGDTWSYSKQIFGIRIFIYGTAILTIVTLLLAVPISIFSAIYLSEIASPNLSRAIRPFVELLVGIPSVVYGIFGLYFLENIFRLYINPFIGSILGFIPVFRNVSPNFGECVLLASLILAIMILPTVTTIAQDAMKAVPMAYREASTSLGATKWETIIHIVLPAASKGILAAIILGMMRAMGETMAVVMLLGNMQKVPDSLLDMGFAMTSKILVDIGFYMAEPIPRSALFAIAAVLFATEILFVGLARMIGGTRK